MSLSPAWTSNGPLPDSRGSVYYCGLGESVWTASANDILEKAKRAHMALDNCRSPCCAPIDCIRRREVKHGGGPLPKAPGQWNRVLCVPVF